MNHLNSLPIKIGAMSDTRVIISCIDYNHELLSISDFQEQVIEQLIEYYHCRLIDNKATIKTLETMGITLADLNPLNLAYVTER